MAAVDSFQLLYREIARSCSCYVEALALVGAVYTASKAVVLARDCYSLIRLHFIPRLMQKGDLVHRFGQWAVVLGASDAIAKAYAEELARQGVSIILISRSRHSMEGIAKAITETHGVAALVVVADFVLGHAACGPLKDALKDKNIGFLVNAVDASLGRPCSFIGMPEDQLWEAIGGSIAAATLVIRLVLPGMVEKGRGAVVNISSALCSKPTPNKAAFTAITAYLDHFSRSLHYEYGHRGVFVQSLVPYRVGSTDQGDKGNTRSCTGWTVPHPQVYARHAISTLGISHRTTGYWPHSLQFWFVQYMPEWMWVWGTRMTS